jgi:hypothetical protein
MLQVEDRLRRPVKVISHKGYLLVQRLERVAYNPPRLFNSTENSWAHLGQAVSTFA